MDITFRPDPWTPQRVRDVGQQFIGSGKEAGNQRVIDLGVMVVAIGELLAAQDARIAALEAKANPPTAQP